MTLPRATGAAGAERLPDRARRLGAGRARSRQCRLARADAGVRRAVGDLSAHDADRERGRGGIAGRADGQQRGRPPDLGAGSLCARISCVSTTRSRTGRSRRTPCCAPRSRTPSGSPDRPRLRRWRAFLSRTPAGDDRARRARRGGGGGRGRGEERGGDGGGTRRDRARLHRRARHAAARGRRLPGRLDATEGARVGSVIGRYWAMDRDRRWDRVQLAYELLVHGRLRTAPPAARRRSAAAYERGETESSSSRRSSAETTRGSGPATA